MDAFRLGELLLGTAPGGAGEVSAQGSPLSVSIMSVVFVLLMIVLLRSFVHLIPFIADSLLRARGSVALESSVRVSRDRNMVALVVFLPMLLLSWRYRLYNPSFLADAIPDVRMGLIAAVFTGYVLLRLLLYRMLKPRRRYEQYQTAHYATFTFFILLVILLLFTAGIMYIFKASDSTIRLILYAEMAFVYLMFLFRKAQILSLSCNHLRTFLYLCGLEILPTAALVVSAVLL